MSLWNIRWFKLRGLTFANLQKICGFILQIPVPPKFSVGCFIEQDGKYLVIDLTYRTGVAFPGGMIVPGENVESALKREVFEETGLTVTDYTYIESCEDIQYGLSVIALAFSVTATGTLSDSTEGTPIWMSPEEIQEKITYNNWKKMFTNYLQR